MTPILSILTPTIPGREHLLKTLADKLAQQIGNLAVEHLVLSDNRARSIGAKRQALVDIARGEYVAFVDDDDDISADYITSLISGCMTGADVVTFRQTAHVNDHYSQVHFRLGQGDHQFIPGGITLRDAWHVCAWKREKVAGCQFLETNYGEDVVWCQQARRRVSTEHHIPEVLHTYRHSESTTAAPMPV